MQVGSIIFQSLKQEAQFSQAVTQSGNTQYSDVMIDNINHVGLYVSDNLVIEATRKHGVVMLLLDKFLSKADYNIVTIIKESSLIDSAIKRAKRYLGLPYNHSFYPDGDGLYCSQLITHSFLNEQGESYFQQYPMNFSDLKTGKILSYWISYYQSLNLAIPQGLLGSHPQQLLRQKHLFSSIYSYSLR